MACDQDNTWRGFDEKFITFRVRRSRGEMCIGHARLYVYVCLSVRMSLAAFPHYCTDPDVTLGMVRGAV